MVVKESADIPIIASVGGCRQLHVRGKPFLILGGELQNSSLTSAEYMEPVWQRLLDSHINTVLGCVTWELIEPVEGEFDFTELDLNIQTARQHGLHLILLWFGAFKNGECLRVSWNNRRLKIPLLTGCVPRDDVTRQIYICTSMGQDRRAPVSSRTALWPVETRDN